MDPQRMVHRNPAIGAWLDTLHTHNGWPRLLWWDYPMTPWTSTSSTLHVFSFHETQSTYAGWWFGTFFIFPYTGNFIIPTDNIFQRGRYTTNQYANDTLHFWTRDLPMTPETWDGFPQHDTAATAAYPTAGRYWIYSWLGLVGGRHHRVYIYIYICVLHCFTLYILNNICWCVFFHFF